MTANHTVYAWNHASHHCYSGDCTTFDGAHNPRVQRFITGTDTEHWRNHICGQGNDSRMSCGEVLPYNWEEHNNNGFRTSKSRAYCYCSRCADYTFSVPKGKDYHARDIVHLW